MKDKLDFPRLIELELWDLRKWFELDDNMGKSLLQKIVDAAPVLDKINYCGYSRILDVLTENKYKFLATFDFDLFTMTNNNDNPDLIEKTWKLIQSGPKITNLSMSQFSLIDPLVLNLLTSLVRRCSDSLEKFEISLDNPLEAMRSLPPLPKLVDLRVNIDQRRLFDLAEFQQVQLQHLFPRLKDVDLRLENSGNMHA